MEYSSGIGVLDKAVLVLRAAAPAPLGLAELCATTGLPRATAHRLAIGLQGHGLLARDAAGRWRPGPLLGALAGGAIDPLVNAAADVLPRLRDTLGESVQLYRPDGLFRVCVAVAEPVSGLRDTVPLGARLSMAAGSAAQVLTAFADPLTQRAVLEHSAFDAAELARVRQLGWARSTAEREPGVSSVSVPVRDSRGTVCAAVSVSSATDRIARRGGSAWAADLQAAAETLRLAVGGPA